MKITKKDLIEALKTIMKESEIAEPKVKPGIGIEPKVKPNPLTPPKQAPRTDPKGVFSENEKTIAKKISDRFSKLKENTYPRATMLNLILEGILDTLEAKYVGEGEGKISQDTFEEIIDVCKGNHNLVGWLANMVSKKIVAAEDVYKFESYLDIFNKNKNQFQIKNIFDYKTPQDIRTFIDTCIEVEERGAGVPEEGGESLASPLEIKKLKDVGILFLGMVDGYQVFEVPKSVANNEETWKVYKTILARCGNRAEGEGIQICTMANFSHFKVYVSQGDTYVFFNMSDPKSPYQMTYEANMFKDKDDNDII